MKQITEEQIAAVMDMAKTYAKSYLKHSKDYEESGSIFYQQRVRNYQNKLSTVCRALETLGLVDDEMKAYLSFLDEAERELRHK